MEALGSLYADRYGLDVVALRIGSALPEPRTPRHLSTWLSPADTVALVDAALTAPAPGFAVVWGVSANTRGWWDLSAARALGYEPGDDAEVYAEAVLATHGEPQPGTVDHDRVGGEYAGPEFSVDAVVARATTPDPS
jgi:uronate dehydrogenase